MNKIFIIKNSSQIDKIPIDKGGPLAKMARFQKVKGKIKSIRIEKIIK